MAAGSDAPNDKKDLTGMYSIPASATPAPGEAPPAAEAPIEKVDSFDSMLPDMSLPEPDYAAPAESPALDFGSVEPAASEGDFDPFAELSAPELPAAAPPPSDFQDDFAPTPSMRSTTPSDPLDDLRQYSHSVQGSSQHVQVFVPYHLYLNGTFGPYERDKLLLFITENDIGLSSQDLDLQIRAGRVFFPRISEFAGVKLIQELRDSGLHFRFTPSERDQDEVVQQTPGVEFNFRPEPADAKPLMPVPVVPEGSKNLADYIEIDSLTLNQYLKAEVVEAERSDLFQEVVDRMLESLKQKARIKGGNALGGYSQTITPLRLPSQYQVTVQATVLKKR
jgi:hypothetical protein